LPANLLYRLLPVGDGSAIDVHVVRHAAVGIAVAGDLYHRDGGEADGATAAGGETDQVAASSRQSRQRYRIIPGRVHEDEARHGHRLGVIDHIDHAGRARLRHRAEGLLEDVAQPALFVSRRRIVVEAAAEAAEILLVPADAIEELFG